MKGILVLGPKCEYEEFNYVFSLIKMHREYEITINADLDSDFEKLISTSGDLSEQIKSSYEFENNPEVIKQLKDVEKNPLKYIQSADNVAIYFELEDIAEYIKRNPSIRNKRIILPGSYDFDMETKSKLKEIFGDDLSYIYLNTPGNSKQISFKEYSDSIDAIDNLVKYIDSFGFSPIEKIMFIYDLVRSREYVREDASEAYEKSRDLSEVLLGNRIVCLGYSKVFEALLEKVGISSKLDFLHPKEGKSGHARNIIYVKDDKYDIDGVYFFDPTWNNNKGNNNYLFSYRFFAITKEMMDKYDEGDLISQIFPIYTPDMVSVFNSVVKNKGIENLPQDLIKSINFMSNMVTGDILINRVGLLPLAPDYLKPDKKKIASELDNIADYFNRPISAEKMFRILYNVRRVEYYLDSSKYPFNMNAFFSAMMNSEWYFEEDSVFDFRELGFGSRFQAKVRANEMKDYFKKEEIDKGIERVRFAKVLRLALDKKTKE